MAEFESTPRTKVKRAPQRAVYERETLYGILDEALICHIGFSVDEQPYVIPTIHVRVDDVLYVHGSPASRMLRRMASGAPVCVTVTLLDGLVLARSAFHHSMNYRSAVVLGVPRKVTEVKEKGVAFKAIVEHLTPGRWDEIRQPNPEEIRKTDVLALQIEEGSAKVRAGAPVDDDVDYELELWAGVLPLNVVAGAAVPDPALRHNLPVPETVSGWIDPQRRFDLSP